MAEARKPAAKDPPAPVLAQAAAAAAPEVHMLLSQRSALQQWNDQQEQLIDAMRAEIAARRSQIDVITQQLADLGYC